MDFGTEDCSNGTILKKSRRGERLEMDTESMGAVVRRWGLCREERGVDLCVAKKGGTNAWRRQEDVMVLGQGCGQWQKGKMESGWMFSLQCREEHSGLEKPWQLVKSCVFLCLLM